MDTIFPNWLINRRDFRMVFTRFQDEDEHSEHDQLVKSFRIAVTRRTHEDFQRISAWMEEKNVLSGLSTRRFLDLAKVRGVLRASEAASIATTAGRSCVRQAEVQRKAERSGRGGGGGPPPSTTPSNFHTSKISKIV